MSCSTLEFSTSLATGLWVRYIPTWSALVDVNRYSCHSLLSTLTREMFRPGTDQGPKRLRWIPGCRGYTPAVGHDCPGLKTAPVVKWHDKWHRKTTMCKSDYTQQVKWRWEFATKPQNPFCVSKRPSLYNSTTELSFPIPWAIVKHTPTEDSSVHQDFLQGHSIKIGMGSGRRNAMDITWTPNIPTFEKPCWSQILFGWLEVRIIR